MCKTITSSLGTFILSFVSVIICLLLAPNDKNIRFLAIFIITYSAMQIADALIWWSLQNDYKKLNAFASRYLLLILLSTQLIISYLGVSYYFGWKNALYVWALVIYIITLIIVWFYGCADDPITKPNNTDGGYLQWCNMQIYNVLKIGFIFFLLFPIVIGMPNTLIKNISLMVITLTFLINFRNETFGSRWCWSSNVLSVFLVIAVFANYCK